ncbi:MAG TPA: glycosyltransferase, partial [bacterium]|nr:glycosyltransferase [bacterium]
RKLRRLAGKLSLSSRVIFRGSCTDIRPFLSLMDLFVLPSHSEGLPNSVLEAMCMKKAVLLSDIPAHREIASDKVSAFFFRPGNPADLAEKIIDLYRQPQTRSEIGDAARKRILSAFSLPAMLEKYRKIYNKILHGTS